VLGPPLIATIRLLLEPIPTRPKARALVATTIRIPATFEAFIDLARKSELSVSLVQPRACLTRVHMIRTGQAGLTVRDLALPFEEIFWGCGEGGAVETEVRLIELTVEGHRAV
jgi:hypothetical protein